MTPDPTRHNPAPTYLRELITRAGLTHQDAARSIGIGYRTMQYYLSENGPRADYPVQFALESLPRASYKVVVEYKDHAK